MKLPKQLKQYKMYMEECKQAVENQQSLLELSEELYIDESNYNNCDKTSGQTAHTREEIYKMLCLCYLEYLEEHPAFMKGRNNIFKSKKEKETVINMNETIHKLNIIKGKI